MRVLAVDPGSVRTGYAVIDAQGELLSYVECGVIEAKGPDKYARLACIADDLQRVIVEHKPETCAMEAGFVGKVKGKHQQGALVSAAARGVAGMVAAKCGLPVIEYAPATVKLAATGRGNADKPTVARLVTVMLGLHRQPEPDAADALAIAVAHARAVVAERRARAA